MGHFFHLKPDDQRAMFPIFAMHAASGGILMFNAGFGLGEAIGSYRGDPLYHAGLDAAEYESLLDDEGFELVEHSVQRRPHRRDDDDVSSIVTAEGDRDD